MYTISLDVSFDLSIGDFLEEVKKHHGSIKSIESNGVLGAPIANLTFPSINEARAYVNQEYSPDMDPEENEELYFN